MKHLPNLLTLANLFCGCIAIAYILTAQPYTSMSLENGGLPTWKWVYGAEQMYYGGIFIFIAAVCDMLDGMVARALKVFSPIGKDLDSLADVVSFGVAPSMIMFKLLWDALMGEKNAFDVSMLGMAPAFLIACFAALRLAKFNITSTAQKSYFIGMPVPATGILIGSFPLIVWYNPYNIASLFQNKWLLYFIIALVLVIAACKPAITPEKLYGTWKYTKVENPGANPPSTDPDWKLKMDNPSIVFSKNNELIIWWGGKVLAHGTFKVDKENIMVKQDMPDGTTHEFPFYVSQFKDNQMVFETLGTEGTRVTAVKQ